MIPSVLTDALFFVYFIYFVMAVSARNRTKAMLYSMLVFGPIPTLLMLAAGHFDKKDKQ